MFKGDGGGDVEGSVRPSYGVFGKGTTRRHHLVEGGDPVAGLELVDIGANTVDVACDIVATVEVGFHVIGGDFPRGCVS